MEQRPTYTVAELTTIMRDVVGTLLMAPDLTTESDLFDAGLDSMAVAQLLLEIETRTGVWIDESQQTRENLGSCKSLAASVFSALAVAR